MEWLKKNKKIMLVVTIIVAILLCAGLWSCRGNQKNEEQPVAIEDNENKEEKKVAKLLDVEGEYEDEVEVEKEEKETSEKPEKEKAETTKKEESKKEDTKKEDTKKEEKHTHDWVAVYKEVDNGHYEKVLVKEAWTEEIVKQRAVGAEICKGCGHAMFTEEDIENHTKPAMLAGNTKCGTYKSGYVIQDYTITVEHPAEYKDVWVPKIEKELTGYKCSCGATK